MLIGTTLHWLRNNDINVCVCPKDAIFQVYLVGCKDGKSMDKETQQYCCVSNCASQIFQGYILASPAFISLPNIVANDQAVLCCLV